MLVQGKTGPTELFTRPPQPQLEPRLSRVAAAVVRDVEPQHVVPDSMQRSAMPKGAKLREELVELFRDSSEQRRSTWRAALLQLPEDAVTSAEFWDDFTHWLVNDYRIPAGSKGAGEYLHHTSTIVYLGCAMNLCKNQLKPGRRRDRLEADD